MQTDPLVGDQSLAAHQAPEMLRLAALVPIVRDRLGMDSSFPDDAVLASLRMIAAPASPWERWQAAFHSNLGHWLGLKADDLNAALNVLVETLPASPPSQVSST
jgi:hypothetical protein